MTQKNDTGILLAALLITAIILAGGYWFLIRNKGNPSLQTPSQTSLPTTASPYSATSSFSLPSQVPTGTIVSINGSTSMVLINESLKNNFMAKFEGTTVKTNAQGTDKGILSLLTGQIDIAALSRPLTPQEQSQGLAAIPVAQDAIAIVVGIDNPFQGSLSRQQLKDIFQGKITDWSQVGGKTGTIRVINRPAISGTHQIFQKMALNGQEFGNSANFTQMQRDATTPILQALGNNGISYATYVQVADQQTVRVLSVEGSTPEAAQYPYQRTFYYAYRQPPSAEVAAFLGYVTSAEGQGVIRTVQ